MGIHASGRHVAALVVAAATVALFACAPSPRDVPCRNGGDCEAAGEGYNFCLDGRCVECVGRGSCDGNPCNDGVCQYPCKGARDCPDGRECVEGTCGPR